ncbi:MAG: hypothetical protein AABY15_08025 [Nanoarchaeota archaeon]
MVKEGGRILIERGPTIGIFGRGGSVEIKDISKGVSKAGYTRLIFEPTNELMHIYRIPNSEIHQEGYYLDKEYPTKYIKWVNHSPTTPRVFILCDYHGNPTPLTEREGDLLNSIDIMEETIEKLKEDNARLSEIINDMVERSFMVELRKMIREENQETFMKLLGQLRGRISSESGGPGS